MNYDEMLKVTLVTKSLVSSYQLTLTTFHCSRIVAGFHLIWTEAELVFRLNSFIYGTVVWV